MLTDLNWYPLNIISWSQLGESTAYLNASVLSSVRLSTDNPIADWPKFIPALKFNLL